ncbi:MAG: PRC-barrel domain-containing protein [Methanobacterium sp.]|jgi:sporulation protein YlmC with PRC-barrel domain|nr:PRC-barrel domain-containing protein [Methanobacterium sp.]
MRIMEEIIGKEVLDNSAMIIGRVKDVEVDAETNQMEAFIISKGGISESLGLSGNEIVIPFTRVKQIGDKILLEDEMEYDI